MNTPDLSTGTFGDHIAIVGYGRHGKDDAALTLHRTGKFTQYGSTSWAALPDMAEYLGVPQQVAWEERHKKRELWKAHCDYLRRDDPCLLIKRLLRKGNIVSGIRDKIEMDVALERGYFKHVLWIDRPGFPADPTVTFDKSVATEIIVNDSTLLVFRLKILNWACRAGFLSKQEEYAAGESEARRLSEEANPQNER